VVRYWSWHISGKARILLTWFRVFKKFTFQAFLSFFCESCV
jgi:hypothetical protein